MKLFITFLTLIQIKLFEAIAIYESEEALNATDPFAGLKFIRNSTKQDSDFTQGVTFCVRFNFNRLSDGSTIFSVENPGRPLAVLAFAGYQETFLFFGGMNWIVKDPESQTFRLWTTNKWHHMCLGYDRNSSFLTLIRVKIALIITFGLNS